LESKKINYEFVNVKKAPIDKKKLHNIAGIVGMDLVFNMKGPTFRKMKLDYSSLSEEKKLDLLFENQNMIKRPLMENNNNYMVGFDENKILEFVNQ
jgi:Spx/MgsR family transcriptional regulator